MQVVLHFRKKVQPDLAQKAGHILAPAVAHVPGGS